MANLPSVPFYLASDTVLVGALRTGEDLAATMKLDRLTPCLRTPDESPVSGQDGFDVGV